MVALIAGLIAFGLGVTGLVFWIAPFWWVIKGTFPALFILGGLLAIYLGVEELKDRRLAEKEGTWETGAAAGGGGEDVSKYKAEVEELKAKLADLEKKEDE